MLDKNKAKLKNTQFLMFLSSLFNDVVNRREYSAGKR